MVNCILLVEEYDRKNEKAVTEGSVVLVVKLLCWMRLEVGAMKSFLYLGKMVVIPLGYLLLHRMPKCSLHTSTPGLLTRRRYCRGNVQVLVASFSGLLKDTL